MKIQCESFWLFNGSQALSLWGRKEVHKHLCVLFTNLEGQTKTLRQILIYLKEPTNIHAQGPKSWTLKLSKSSCLLNFSKTLPSETNNLTTNRGFWRPLTHTEVDGVLLLLLFYMQGHMRRRESELQCIIMQVKWKHAWPITTHVVRRPRGQSVELWGWCGSSSVPGLPHHFLTQRHIFVWSCKKSVLFIP